DVRFALAAGRPRHSHSADCLYYVVSGEAHMGSRVLKPGDGFFILAEAPYAYTAGPEGVEVLEFRHATTFDIKIRDKTLEHWKPVIEAIKAHGESWAPAPVGAAGHRCRGTPGRGSREIRPGWRRRARSGRRR